MLNLADEVILGVTTGGWVKVWTVNEKEVRPREQICEHESKLIHSLNALCLVCCAYNQRTVLIVTQEDWQVTDALFEEVFRPSSRLTSKFSGQVIDLLLGNYREYWFYFEHFYNGYFACTFFSTLVFFEYILFFIMFYRSK